jgi:hypothetical protein
MVSIRFTTQPKCATVAAQAAQAAQVAITHRFRRYLRFTLALGTAAGLLILGTFCSSALWCFIQMV